MSEGRSGGKKEEQEGKRDQNNCAGGALSKLSAGVVSRADWNTRIHTLKVADARTVDILYVAWPTCNGHPTRDVRAQEKAHASFFYLLLTSLSYALHLPSFHSFIHSFLSLQNTHNTTATSVTIPSLKPRTLLAVVAVILVMTRARQLHAGFHSPRSSSYSSSGGGSLRNRRPKTKDSLDKEKRVRRLDEAIVTGNIDELRKLSVTGPGFVTDGIRRRAWYTYVP